MTDLLRRALTATCTLALTDGDLTRAKVDAIVNAANPLMLGGGGVDGAIHRAAGPQLKEACYRVTAVNGVRCPVGQARITPGFDLPAKFVIHTVGPRYQLDPRPAALLAAAHRESLKLANAEGLATVAFPAISCGAYGYPLAEAAPIALATACEHAGALREIRFVLFDGAAQAAFVEAAVALLD